MRTRIKTAVLAVALTGLLLAAAWGATTEKSPAAPENPAKVGECTLGDLAADAARAAVTNADVALIPGGHLLPQAIPAGQPVQEQFAEALLFPDEAVVVIELKGNELKEALERSLGFLPRPSPTLLQVAGMSVSYRSADPAGKRVAAVQIGNAPLAADRVYRVAMPASLAKGAMGYYRVFGTRVVKQVGPSLREAVVKYAQTSGATTVAPGQRLRDLSAPAAK